MTDRPMTWVERRFSSWSTGVRRRRRLVLAVSVLLTISAAAYAVRNLGVNTDTSSLVSEDLDWRRTAIAYERAFPGQGDALTVLIDGRTPETADDAAERLARELASDTSTFESIYRPDNGPFFETYGLHYLDTDSLAALVDRVEDARDLFGSVETEPGLAGLNAALARTLADRRSGEATADDVDLGPVLGLLAATAYAASQGRFEPLPWGALVAGRLPTTSERRRTLILQPRLEFANRVPGREAIARVREAASRLGLDDRAGVRVRLTGLVAIEADELGTAIAGVRQAGLLAAVSVAVILFIALRSWRLILLCLATLVIGLVATSAYAALAIGQLNLISVAFAVLYVGLGIDYALHLSLRYRAHRTRGAAPGPAVDLAVAQVGPSLALSALTTAVCFYAFTLTDFVGVAELGLIGGTGMLVSFLVTVTVLPAGLASLPLQGDVGELSHGLPGLARGVRRYRAAILIVAAASAALAIVAVPRATFDENPLNLRDPDAESVRAYRDLLADPVARPLTASIMAASAAAAEAAVESVSHLDEVAETRTLESFIPADQAAKRVHLDRLRAILGAWPDATTVADSARLDGPGDGEAGLRELERLINDVRWIGTVDERTAARQAYHAVRGWRRGGASWTDEERVRQTTSLEAALVGSLPRLLTRVRHAAEAETLDRETLPADLVRRWVSPDGLRRVEVVPAGMLGDTEELRRFVDAVKAAQPEATGDAVTQIETGRMAAVAFRRALLAAGLITAAILMLLLRSAAAAGLVVGPLALAAVWTGGLVVALDMPFNYANVIALPLLLGIGVDNGIHMVHHVRRVGRRSDPLEGSTGRAILFASLTTIASFGNLAFAVHVGMATMGRLLSVGMTCVLVATLLVLPALLPAHEPREGRS